MGLKVYGHISSAPTRVVLMTCNCLKLDYDFVVIDIIKGEHKTEEYAKVNPQQLVPALKDGDFVLTESKAIIAYLVNALGEDSQGQLLYPKDPKVRGKIDQRLYFELGTFYPAFADCSYPIAYGRIDHVKEESLDRLKQVLSWMSDMLHPTGYFGETDHMTLADLAFLGNFASLVATELYPNILEDYPSLKLWFEKCQSQIPGYETINGVGADQYSLWFKSGLQAAIKAKQ